MKSKHSLLCQVLASLVVFCLPSAQAEDQPGWFAYEGERVPHGQDRWGDSAPEPLMAVMSGMTAAAPDHIYPEIEELARNLHHDPNLIFQFVHNKIDYIPYYGFMKSARQTLHERAGNDADIAALLVALLRASGFDAEYVYGVQQIPTTGASAFTAARWLDVEDVPSAVDNTLVNNGIPGVAGSTWTWVDRIWVVSDIDGAIRQLDAGFKPRERVPPLDLAAAMGYSRSALLNDAGGVVASNHVQSLNETNLNNRLANWSTTLADTLRMEHSSAELRDLLGQSRIVELEFAELPTILPFPVVVEGGGETPPAHLMHHVRIQHGGIDETLSFAQIAGRRLSVTYDEVMQMSMAATSSAAGEGEIDLHQPQFPVALPSGPDMPKTTLSLPALAAPESGEPAELEFPFPWDDAGKGADAPFEVLAFADEDDEEAGGIMPMSSHTWLGSFVQGETASWNFYGQQVCHPGSVQTFYHQYFFTENTHSCFGMSPMNLNLQPGQCANVFLTFSAVGKSRGYKYATIYNNWGYNPNGGHYQAGPYQFYAFVAETLQGKIDPTDGEYGWGYLNEQETRQVAIKNNGSQPVQVTITGLGGNHPGRFELVGFSAPHTFNLSSGNTASFSVRYKRDQYGQHLGTVHMSFVYDGFNYPASDIIGLWGSTHRTPNVTTNHINFLTHYYQNPVVQTGSVHNAGTHSLQITSVSIVGTDKDRFEPVTGFGTGSLGAGQTRNIAVRYKADVVGHHWNAAVQVVYTYDGVSGYAAYMYLNGQTVSAPQAQLWLDDDLIAEETGPISEPVSNMTLSFMHPTFTNSTYPATFPLKRGAAYAIIADFGHAQHGHYLEARQRQLDAYRYAGLPDTSREVLTESLNILGHTWMRQTALADDLLDAITNTRRTYHHRFGIMAQEEGYYVDVKAQLFTPIARDGNPDNASARFRADGLMASALEHGMLEQMQGTNNPAASTVKLLQLANHAGQKIFLADSNNYAAVAGQLVNYSTNELASFQGRINAGQTLVLPENAHITLNDWQGTGYIVSGPGAAGLNEIGMIIAGDYYGGYAGIPDNINVSYISGNNSWFHVQSAETPQEPVQDPVDIASGNLLYDRTDLVLGHGAPPTGITLARIYNSGQNTLRSPLGFGWRHSLDIRAQVRSEGASGLGRRTPADAAALLVATIAIEDLIRHEPNAKGWLTAALVAKWAVDQLTDNAVSIQVGDTNIEFIRQPDGTHTPPPGHTAELEKTGNEFLLKQRHGIELAFNANGRLETWTDADGNAMTFAYDAQTNLTSVVDAWGRSLTFTYSGNGSNLVSVADSTGRTVGYTVTGGNLSAVTDTQGHVWNFAYDQRHRLLTHADPLGQTLISNLYSEVTGKVLAQIDANGALWNMFTVPQFRGVEENPLGERTVYWFDDQFRRTAKTDAEGNTSYTAFDGQNRVTLEVDPLWNITQFQYDADHNMTNRINALGHATAFAYDSEHRLVTVRDPLGHETHTEYNAQHHPIKITDALDNETVMTYTADGLLETLTGPRGETVAYTYDAYGNPAAVTRSDGGTETRVHNARGDLLSVTDANTNTTTFTWDNRRLQTSAVDPLGGVVSNVYDGAELLVTNINPRGGVTAQTWTPMYELESIRYPDGGTISNVYDAANRLVAVVDPLGHVRSNVYDAAGRLVQTVNPLGHTTHYTLDPVGNLVSVENAAGHVTSNVYDALNRVIVTMDPLGHSVTNTYNEVGRLIAVTDKLGRVTEYEYDALGRLERQVRGDIEHRFEFDAAGNRTAYINPKNARLEFRFDLMNRVVAETNAIGHVTLFAYDSVGNLIQKTKPDSETIAYHYDALNRLTNRLSETINHHYAYDLSGNLTNLTDGLGVTVQTFDEMDRLLTVADPFGQTVTNEYNLAGQRTRIVYPDGKAQDFAYDPAARLANTTASAFGVSAVSFSFDSVNNLTGITRPGGIASTFAHDPLGRIVGYTAHNGASNFIQRTITRNALGFKTQEQIQAGLEVLTASSSQTHVHNPADQILDVYHNTPGMTVVPWYDPNGNLTQVVHTVMIEGVEPPLVFTSTYEYDFDNRLVVVESPLLVAEYAYDGLGHLLQIIETGTIRRLVRDHADPLTRPLMLTDVSGDPVQTYLWANGSLIAQVETGAVRYAHFNELGHLLALTDESGAVTDEFAYHPYGRLVARTGTTQTPFLFMGQFGVMASGYDLYLTRHRAYNANLMRWHSVDPLGIEGGANLYAYTGGNPVFYVDILGLHKTESGGYPGGWLNPGNLWRGLYTGDPRALDEVYNASVDAAGDYLYNNSAVRGAYVGVGWNGKQPGEGSPAAQAGITSRWTIDQGATASVDFGLGLQERGRNSLGQFTSQTIGAGGSYAFWSESQGFQSPIEGTQFTGIYGGSKNRAGGTHFGISTAPNLALGLNYGPVYGGLIIDPSKIVGNFRDTYDVITGSFR